VVNGHSHSSVEHGAQRAQAHVNLSTHIGIMASPSKPSSADYARHHASDASRPEDQRKQFAPSGGRLVRSKSFTTAEEEKRHHLLWSLMQQYLGNDKKSLQTDIVQHIEYTLCRTRLDFTKFHGFQGIFARSQLTGMRFEFTFSFRHRPLHPRPTHRALQRHQSALRAAGRAPHVFALPRASQTHTAIPFYFSRRYYLSLEFLVGRLLRNAACNLGIESTLSEALGELGYVLEDIYEEERDPALGNGGLGRLAGKRSSKK
jgi:starch phosphorylase